MSLSVVETERLLLRRFEMTDVEDLSMLDTDAEVRRLRLDDLWLLGDEFGEVEYASNRSECAARGRASGDFDTAFWSSTGVHYDVEVASAAGAEEIEGLLRIVDDVAEIPKALRSGTSVTRRPPG